MPTIVHFEIPSDDIERTKKFYTDLFGWKIEKWPGTDNSQLTSAAGQPMEYWMVTTTDAKRLFSSNCGPHVLHLNFNYIYH